MDTAATRRGSVIPMMPFELKGQRTTRRLFKGFKRLLMQKGFCKSQLYSLQVFKSSFSMATATAQQSEPPTSAISEYWRQNQKRPSSASTFLTTFTAYKGQLLPGITSFIKKLGDLGGFTTARLSTYDDNGVLINGFHDDLLFSQNGQL